MKKDKGFTIIELLVAVVMVSLIAVSIVPLYINSIKATRSSANKAKATNIAAAKIEELRNREFTALVNNETFSVIELGGNGTIMVEDQNWDGVGGITTAEQELKKITVRVSWSESGRALEISLPTYIAQNGINKK
ncbi:TPA: hypothetical protein DDW69_02755 [candidate division CPR2 bacterium]|uniref:Prepilin-type N-terminal cleavage/methylation domain-containing protein n=1 Tax=candidate division CPR2 bacterium GW2011_GWC1_41_48 TaxID=1618344 RepID=A0A0G0YI27_UNCC2|nr:MAG: hypothetical protein UT47_C0003G0247 [candidate division CPR2 bacterium GW2011_GWC2_39_35]KKR28186.1 MAG: hypothetical protein UT59_C0033G0003 [candidate division CPR2 bacterium GW2011_GWD1_39_7]KKR29280.1 MAG: hypothetical protein UT60_C0004G0017 [candidate division CPR2 bacterium GW2011_GWD2_39_7]KKS09186.1 MAG: hypothetical protein UU65_C0003G0241 [candidate division CPR2 bacterium GW2011_GWC1_41_48]OGB60355.1 MAG: hypothetical protein A2Y27_03080 [candidate division CPR2 bacterium G